MVARSLASAACAAWARTFSISPAAPRMPLLAIASGSARSASNVPACWISADAVFSPIPLMPGMLSIASPMSPMMSTQRSGSMP